MKTLVSTDVIIQTLLGFALIMTAIDSPESVSFFFYAIIGGYQLIIHFIKYFAGLRGTGRKIYHYALVLYLLACSLSIIYMRSDDNITQATMLFYVFMALAGPVMAIYHYSISIAELNKKY